MMAVSTPVLPPSFEPDPFPSTAQQDTVAPSASVPFPALASPFIPMGTHATSSRSNAKLEPAEIVVKSLPPTPEPSPPTAKVLFPADLAPLAPLIPFAGTGSRTHQPPHRLDEASPSSSADSHSGHGHNQLRSSILVSSPTEAVRPLLTPQPSIHRSDTQSSLSRSSARSSKSEVDRDPRRVSKTSNTRRQTMGGPTSVRMVESRSADSRTRLRSAGGANLPRYPTPDYLVPSGSRVRRIQTDSAAPPPRIVVPRSSAELDDLDFGGPGGLEAKLVLLGSQGVGKTSLILRLTTGAYAAVPSASSVSSSFYKRRLVHNGVPVKLQIWDTAGQERFRSMAPIYYRGAHVCLLVYDISDRKSFEDVRSWLDELHTKASKDMIIYVVGAKLDLERQRAVSLREARRTIQSWLRPDIPQPPDPESTLHPGRSLFRSASGRKESTTTAPTTAARARPHSMHGLASLMGADWGDLEPVKTTPSPSPALPAQLAPSPVPSPAPTVHFPSSLAAPSTTDAPSTTPSVAGSSTVNGSSTTNVRERKRSTRVSFHSPAPPTEITPRMTAETATASTSHQAPRHSSRFSISGVLGLTRVTSPTISDAMSNLTHLAEANPVHLWTQTPRSSFSPGRARTESSPLLSDVPPKRRSDELPGRSWHRTSTADALEEFGAVVRHEAARTSRSNSYDDGRARGGSLGRDSRLFHSADSSDEEEEDPVNGWGVEIENVRLGEVSSLTGEGVEAMCRSISACLVDRKDKIERERTLRHKNSVMLTEATPASEAATAKHRFACCA